VLALLVLHAQAPVVLAAAGDSLTVGDTDNSWWDNTGYEENDFRITVWDNDLRLLGESCVLYISFDELPAGFGNTDNTVYDLTSYLNDGTAVNGPVETAGKFDNALSFDGSDDYIEIPHSDSLNFGKPVTIAVWIKPDTTTPTWQTVLERSSGGSYETSYWLRMGENNIGFEFGDGSAWHAHRTTTGPVEVGVWQFYVATYDGSYVKIYKNGAEILSEEETADPWTGTARVRIGVRACALEEYYDGAIEEPMVLNRALTAEEVEWLYHRTKPTYMAGDDFKTGTWISSWWDVGDTASIDSIEITADNQEALGTLENIMCIVSVNDNPAFDGAEDNVTITVDPGTNTYLVDKRGRYVAVTFQLETENTTHTPIVDSYTIRGQLHDQHLSLRVVKDRKLDWSCRGTGRVAEDRELDGLCGCSGGVVKGGELDRFSRD